MARSDDEQWSEQMTVDDDWQVTTTSINDSSLDVLPEEVDEFVLYLMTFVAPILFAAITVIGVAGNGLVIYVIAANPRMRSSVTTLLLLNLAIADLLFLFICVPFTAYKFHSFSWSFGNLACQLAQFSLFVSVYVTVYTLVAISVLRYVMVVRAHNTQVGGRADVCKVVWFIVLLWLCVTVLNIPTLMSHTTKQYENYTYCGVEDGAVAPIFFTFCAFGYVIPLLAIGVLYASIVRFLRSRKPTSIDQQRTRERTSRACRVVSLVVVVFGIAWLPHHVNAIASLYYALPTGRFYTVLRIVWYCMSYGNSCVNPFIYNYASEEFRAGFRRAVGCCLCCSSSSSSATATPAAATTGPATADFRTADTRHRRSSPAVPGLRQTDFLTKPATALQVLGATTAPRGSMEATAALS